MQTNRPSQGGNPPESGSPSSIHGESPSSEERREATRFGREEKTDFAVIWREPGEEWLVEVHDESLTGLGIVVESKQTLEVGSMLKIVYTGEFMECEVRHIQQQGDRYRIGLQCRRSLSDQ